MRAQSVRLRTACSVHCLAPLGEPWYATRQPQSSTQYTPLDITLTKSRSHFRWKASILRQTGRGVVDVGHVTPE
jgi:hypothetical protein